MLIEKVAIASFATYIMVDANNVLDAQKAFVSLSIFNILRRPLAFFPQLITSTMMVCFPLFLFYNFLIILLQFLVSIRRINRFLDCDELQNQTLNTINANKDKSDSQIVMKNASFKWDKEDTTPVLKNINLNVKPNKLIAIVGRVGSGKSSILSALLGEMQLIEGQSYINGTVAYVPQQAWIRNASVRSNILFGKEFKIDKYNAVIQSCALEPDFSLLSGID